jgi:predicted TIM-barrel fold metal-dependent hydrolase
MVYKAKGRKKGFPVFDCDSHIHEPPDIWNQYIPTGEREFVKKHFFRDIENLVVVRNGAVTFLDERKFGRPGEAWHPGLDKKVIGSTRPGTREWHEKIGRNAIQRDPRARLLDMDASGIDQVMVFPSFGVNLPLVKSAEAARIYCRAYNDWVNDYCSVNRKRLFPCGLLPVQDVNNALAELRRVAKLGFKTAAVRPVISNGRYPTFPEFDPLWREFEALGMALCMHTFPSFEPLTADLGRRMAAGRRGPVVAEPNTEAGPQFNEFNQGVVYSPGQFLQNVVGSMGSVQPAGAALSFIAEAETWTLAVLLTGWLEKFPRLKVAILESNSSWLPLILEKAETYLDLHRYVREMAEPPERTGDPQEVFYRQCYIAFESDEHPTFRMWDWFENIGLWSSDMPHFDAADAWEAIDNMNRWGVPPAAQEKMLGANARRLYQIEPELVVIEAPEEYQPVKIPVPAGHLVG